jgi:two-component system chemotaxis response regulator CheB
VIHIVVIAASAGGLDPLRRIITALPVPCAAAVFVVMHIAPNRSMLPHLLSDSGQHPAIFAQDGTLSEAGHIYVAPPDHHMFPGPDCIRLDHGSKVHHTRPAADPLFISAAETHGQRVMGIVLSGGNGDGAAGLRANAEHGGTALVQDPQEAEAPSMPRAAMIAAHPDACLPVNEIARRVNVFCSHDWKGGDSRYCGDGAPVRGIQSTISALPANRGQPRPHNFRNMASHPLSRIHILIGSALHGHYAAIPPFAWASSAWTLSGLSAVKWWSRSTGKSSRPRTVASSFSET